MDGLSASLIVVAAVLATACGGSTMTVRAVTCAFGCGRGGPRGRLGSHAVVVDLRCDATDVGARGVPAPGRRGQGRRVALAAPRGRRASPSGDPPRVAADRPDAARSLFTTVAPSPLGSVHRHPGDTPSLAP